MAMNDSLTEGVWSPCVNECCLNEQDVCLGCGRSLTEIKQWSVVTDEIRRTFLQNAQIRQQKHTVV